MSDDQLLNFVLRMKDEASSVLDQYTTNLKASGQQHTEVAKEATTLRDRLREVSQTVKATAMEIASSTLAQRAYAAAIKHVSENKLEMASHAVKVARAVGLVDTATAFTTVRTLALIVAVKESVRVWGDYEAAMTRFNARAQAISYTDLNRLARQTARETTFGASQVVSSGEALSRFGRLDRDTFVRTLRASLDLANAEGGDANETARALGRILNNPLEGATEARRRFQNLTTSDIYRLRQLEEGGDYNAQRQLVLGRVEQDTKGAADLGRPGLRQSISKAAQEVGGLIDENMKGLGRFVSVMLDLNGASLDLAAPLRSVVDLFGRIARAGTDASRSTWRFVAGAEDPVERLSERMDLNRRMRAQIMDAGRETALRAAGADPGSDPESLTREQRVVFDRAMERHLRSRGLINLDQEYGSLQTQRDQLRPGRGLNGDQRTRVDAVLQQWEGLDDLREQRTRLGLNLNRANTAVSDLEGMDQRWVFEQSPADQMRRLTELQRAREVAAALATQLRALKDAWQQLETSFDQSATDAGLGSAGQQLESLRRQAATAFAGVTGNNTTFDEAMGRDEVLTAAREQWLTLIRRQGELETITAELTREARDAVTEAILRGVAAEEEANRQLTIRQRLVEKFGAEGLNDPRNSQAIAAERQRLDAQTGEEQARRRAEASTRFVAAINEQIRAEAALALAGQQGTQASREAARQNEAHAQALKTTTAGTEEYRREMERLLTLLRQRDAVMGERLTQDLLGQARAWTAVAEAARGGAAAFQQARDAQEALARGMDPRTGGAAIAAERGARQLTEAQQAEFDARVRRAGSEAAARAGGNSFEQEQARIRAEGQERLRIEQELQRLRRQEILGTPEALPPGWRRDALNVPSQFQGLVSQAAQANNIPVSLLASYLQQESGWNPRAENPTSSARGIAQILETTALRPGNMRSLAPNDRFDPEKAIPWIAEYIRLRAGRDADLNDPAVASRVLRSVGENTPKYAGEVLNRAYGVEAGQTGATEALRVQQGTQLADMETRRREQLAASRVEIEQGLALTRRTSEELNKGTISVEQMGVFQQAFRAAQQLSLRGAGDFEQILQAQLRLMQQRTLEENRLRLAADNQLAQRRIAVTNRTAELDPGLSDLQREYGRRRIEAESQMRAERLQPGSTEWQDRLRLLDDEEQATRRLAQSQNALARYGNFEGQESWQRYSSLAVQGLNNINDAMADVLTGATTLGQGVANIGKMMGSMLARELMKELVTAPIARGLSGLFSGASGAAAGSGGSGMFSGIFSAIGSLFGFADGGVMTSAGPMALRRYATGGIANSPQLALYGEGSKPEAFVPLPDGRTIPVTMNAPSPVVAPSTPMVNSSVSVQVNVAAPEGGGGAGGGGGALSPDQAARLSNDVSRMVQATVAQELERHLRPRGMLNPSTI